jgi:hypothetical protein
MRAHRWIPAIMSRTHYFDMMRGTLIVKHEAATSVNGIVLSDRAIAA